MLDQAVCSLGFLSKPSSFCWHWPKNYYGNGGLKINLKKQYKSTLIATVGGSPAPIVTALETYKPDFVIFICSPQSQHQVPDIINQVPLSFDHHILIIQKIDSPEKCYQICEQAFALAAKVQSEKIFADFSGGTKSMSLALGLTALGKENCRLSVAIGVRRDLIKVVNGTQVSTPFNPWNVYGYIRIKELLELTNRYQFETVFQECTKIETFSPNEDLSNMLLHLKSLSKAFSYWDVFDHKKALNCLSNYEVHFHEQIMLLKKLTGQIEGHGYEKILDLITNASRKISLGMYDDAVARLYRSLEMLAQTELELKYNLQTSDIDTSNLPLNLRPKYESKRKRHVDNKVQLGLIEAFDLLCELEDPLGMHFANLKNQLLNYLQLRNYSILAHGTQIVSKKQARDFFDFCKQFVTDCLGTINIKDNFKKYEFPQITLEHLG